VGVVVIEKKGERKEKREVEVGREGVFATLAFARLAFLLSPKKLTLTMSNPVVFFDISANDAPLGRIEMTVRSN